MAGNGLPLGSLRTNDEGRIFVKVRLRPAKWVRRSHLVYEQETGEKVPRGYVLHHRDEDKTNDAFSNLELMTNADHVRLHKLGNQNTKGIKQSKEHREKLRIARIGFKLSEESRAKISKSLIGNKNGLGRTGHSDETRERLGRVHRGVPKSPEQREKMAAARRAWWDRKRQEQLG